MHRWSHNSKGAKPRQDKGTVWKAAYHNGRALMNVSQGLRDLAK